MDYEKAYTEAVSRAKLAIKDCGHNEGRKRMIEEIFPELAESEDERNKKIKKEVIEMLHYYHSKSPCFIPPQFSLEETLAWLEKQGKRKPMWSEVDEMMFTSTINSLKLTNGACDMKIDWLKSLKDRYTWKPNVEQLTAFAQHLNKRGAFRDDLCMDFDHEAQSFIEMQDNKEL